MKDLALSVELRQQPDVPTSAKYDNMKYLLRHWEDLTLLLLVTSKESNLRES